MAMQNIGGKSSHSSHTKSVQKGGRLLRHIIRNAGRGGALTTRAASANLTTNSDAASLTLDAPMNTPALGHIHTGGGINIMCYLLLAVALSDQGHLLPNILLSKQATGVIPSKTWSCMGWQRNQAIGTVPSETWSCMGWRCAGNRVLGTRPSPVPGSPARHRTQSGGHEMKHRIGC